MKLYFIIFLTIICYSCAQIVTPTGGDKDLKAPELLSSNPINKSTNFNNKKIKLIFNELIGVDIKNISCFPNLKYPLDIKVNKNILEIKFNDKEILKENTSYTIFFNNSIFDLTEKNLKDVFKFAFSTGNVLDTTLFKIYGNYENNNILKTFNIKMTVDNDTFIQNNINKTIEFTGLKNKNINVLLFNKQGLNIYQSPKNNLKLIKDTSIQINIYPYKNTDSIKIKSHQWDNNSDYIVFNRPIYESDLSLFKIENGIFKIINDSNIIKIWKIDHNDSFILTLYNQSNTYKFKNKNKLNPLQIIDKKIINNELYISYNQPIIINNPNDSMYTKQNELILKYFNDTNIIKNNTIKTYQQLYNKLDTIIIPGLKEYAKIQFKKSDTINCNYLIINKLNKIIQDIDSRKIHTLILQASTYKIIAYKNESDEIYQKYLNEEIGLFPSKSKILIEDLKIKPKWVYNNVNWGCFE